jgi:hypothetical protein
MAQVIVGVFPDRVPAEDAIIALKEAGFDPTHIGFVTRHSPEAQRMAGGVGTDLGADLGTGAATGGILGGALGAILAATGTFVIPGVGPFIAAGILASAIVGGAAGAIVGGLVGLGVPREEAEYYNRRVQQGATLVTVDAPGHEDEARTILMRRGAEDTWSTAPWNSPAERDNRQVGRNIESPRAETMTPDAAPLHRTAPIFPPAIDARESNSPKRIHDAGNPPPQMTAGPEAPARNATAPNSERVGAPPRDRGSVVGPGDAVQHGMVTDPFGGKLRPDRPAGDPLNGDREALRESNSPAAPDDLRTDRPPR